MGGLTPEPSRRPETAGSRAGRYTLLDHFASGGTADLWVAVRDGSRDVCLLKRLAPELVADPRAARRLQREASIAFRLSHPSFARMLSAGDEGGRFCIATELVAGQNAAVMMHRVREQGVVVPLEVALAVAVSVLEGLAHLHGLRDEEGQPMSLVHRDLSSANVLVGFGGDVKIIDFGAMHARIDDLRTAPGVIVGTPEAMSPEQALGGTVDQRTDLYAVGVLLYQLLTGRNPFSASNLIEVLERVRSFVPPLVSTVRSDVPRALAEVVARSMHKSVDHRYRDALEMQHALLESAGVRPASKDAIARFTVGVMPDELARIQELMARGQHLADAMQDFMTEESIQQGAFTRTGYELPSEAASQVRTSIVRVRGDDLAPVIPLPRRGGSSPRVTPSAFTPSVMEMPGTAVVKVSGTQLVRDTRALRSEVDRWRARFVAAIAAGVAGMLVVGVAVALWVSRSATPAGAPVVAGAPEVAPAPVAATRGEPLADAEGGGSPTLAEPSAPAKAKAAAPSRAARPEGARIAEPSRPLEPSRLADAPRATEPAASAEPQRSAAPAPAATPKTTAQDYAPLRAALRRLQDQQPRDNADFEALLAQVKEAAKSAPPSTQKLINSDLSAAERSYDLEPLAAAIAKLSRQQ